MSELSYITVRVHLVHLVREHERQAAADLLTDRSEPQIRL